TLFRSQRAFFLRRHFAGLHTVEEKDESVQLIAIWLRKRKLIDSQVPLLHIRIMALRTVKIKKLAGSGREISGSQRKGIEYNSYDPESTFYDELP
ncbi:MAG: hypothetical protein WCT04_07265, partial [Planctomycetota bacterium]